ncbi:MAG: ATP-binding protein [Thermofilaceae archaeon]
MIQEPFDFRIRMPKEALLLVGDWYNSLVNQVAAVARYQWRQKIVDGIRGYIFHGEPGTGKTWAAWKIAEVLGLIDLCKKGYEAVVFRDCADLASWRYGETEREIRNVFKKAYETAETLTRLKRDAGVLLIFDDAEGLFLTRSYGSKLDTWYIAQLNVFFHEIDFMDTSKLFVILTTNRIDLLDEALKDRFISVEFELPPKEVLVKFAEEKLKRFGIDDEEVIEKIRREVFDKARTFRDVHRLITQEYVDWIAKKYSLF